jgi:phosphoribosylaminoimidazolecarboxamide formyltransferase/IMP cyclohydrolase
MLPATDPTLVPIKRALISVTDKEGVAEFAMALSRMGVEIVSTGGTATLLASRGVPVRGIEEVTGFPEIMHGRVKTLHPKVHGGILAVRDMSEHVEAMQQHGIEAIDLVCVNLYAFEQTTARAGCTREEAVENIDIGGPSMIRSAAKNHTWVTVVTRPQDYQRVLDDMGTHGGATTQALRAELAAEAFSLTSRYDAAIAAYLTPRAASEYPPLLTLSYVRSEELRYGENPHQSAALYREARREGPTIAHAEQLHGKELSYNNINDSAAALELVKALRLVEPGSCGACVIKHTNPCGGALAGSAMEAIDEAIAGDPLAAFGGIVAVNAEVDGPAAERMCRKDVFLEVIIAPAFTLDALTMLRTRWSNVRLLAVGRDLEEGTPGVHAGAEMRAIPGGLLVQQRDVRLAGRGECRHAAGPAPSDEQWRVAAFLEVVGRSLLSNAVVLGGPSLARKGVVRMYGGGAGQMDRLTSCRLAVEKAGPLAKGSVAFSDAFFPFPDGPEALIDAGVSVIVHPGGSKRDQETLDLCEARGVTCLLTGLRHFRH